MAKKGMRRPGSEETHGTDSTHKTNTPKTNTEPVPELQGKAKHSKEKSKPIG